MKAILKKAVQIIIAVSFTVYTALIIYQNTNPQISFSILAGLIVLSYIFQDYINDAQMKLNDEPKENITQLDKKQNFYEAQWNYFQKKYERQHPNISALIDNILTDHLFPTSNPTITARESLTNQIEEAIANEDYEKAERLENNIKYIDLGQKLKEAMDNNELELAKEIQKQMIKMIENT
jgi:hypothetical protein